MLLVNGVWKRCGGGLGTLFTIVRKGFRPWLLVVATKNLNSKLLFSEIEPVPVIKRERNGPKSSFPSLRTITDGKRRYHPVIYSASGQLKPS